MSNGNSYNTRKTIHSHKWEIPCLKSDHYSNSKQPVQEMKVTPISSLLCLFLMAVTALTLAESRKPALHRVGGGKYTWKPNVNYTEWAEEEKFFVGDWLYFGFDKQVHNVLQVNETSYNKCVEQDFIKNITRGGRDVFNLTKPMPYYFICGRGFCFQGMKVAVHVVEDIPTTPSPPPANVSSGSTPHFCHTRTLMLLMVHSFLLLCLVHRRA